MATKARETGLGPGLWAAIFGLACVCCLLLVWLGLHVARTLAEAEDLHQKHDDLRPLVAP